MNLNAELKSWEEIEKEAAWNGILIGQEFSSLIGVKFAECESLYEKACNDTDFPMSQENKSLFDKLKTKQFEEVFSALSTCKEVVDNYQESPEFDKREILNRIENQYRNLKTSLISTLKQVHISWININAPSRFSARDRFQYPSTSNKASKLNSIKEEVRKYKFVYYINYDLILYWSMMINFDPKKLEFIDFFCKKEKDENNDFVRFDNSNILDKDCEVTKVFYHHGGLHLCIDFNGTKKIKYKHETKNNILEQLEHYWMIEKSIVPLFICEGTAQEKLSAIHRSEYLTFAYKQLENDQENLVIFGCDPNKNNQHLWEAVSKAQERNIAISIRRNNTTNDEIIKLKSKWMKALPNKQIMHFFQSETHPLYPDNLKS
jgi:hypothetical protein